MRFCPLIGEKGCREDCLFRADLEKVGLPDAKGGVPNVFAETWGTPQSQCGLLVALSVCAEIACRTAGQDAIDETRAIETVRRMGVERFEEAFNNDFRTNPNISGPSPVAAAQGRMRALRAKGAEKGSDP